MLSCQAIADSEEDPQVDMLEEEMSLSYLEVAPSPPLLFVFGLPRHCYGGHDEVSVLLEEEARSWRSAACSALPPAALLCSV